MTLSDDLCASAFAAAAGVLKDGAPDKLSIAGGTEIPALEDAEDHGQGFDELAPINAAALTLVSKTYDFLAFYPLPAGEYLKEPAVWAGRNFRVQAIRTRGGFVVLELTGEEQG